MKENKNTWPAWISVNDQLPPNEDFVLACVIGRYDKEGPETAQHITFDRACVIASYFAGTEFDEAGWELDGYPEHDPKKLLVTHWMALPEPPQEVGRYDA